MSTSFYPVVGRKGTGLQLRLPIVTVQKDHPEQFTLLVLALLLIQDRGASVTQLNLFNEGINAQDIVLPPLPGGGVLSSMYYNIAAIHGKPYTIWPGDPTPTPSNYKATDPKDTNPVPSRFGGLLCDFHYTFSAQLTVRITRILQVCICL